MSIIDLSYICQKLMFQFKSHDLTWIYGVDIGDRFDFFKSTLG